MTENVLKSNKKIALLIDCDNISFRVIEKVLQELEEYGEVIIKRAYGNWRNDGLKNWVTKLTELSIKPIHQIDYTKGKNATDMAIVIDAMDLMHLKKVEAFAIVSSDSDFTPLVMKLQEEGYKVYGFGNEKAPISLKNSCSVFTDVSVSSVIDEKIKEKAKPAGKMSNKELSKKAIEVFLRVSPENKQIPFEVMNKELKENGMDYKDLGFAQFKLFLDNLNVFNLLINDKRQGFVSLKQNSQKDSDVIFNVNEDVELINQINECFDALNVEKGGRVLTSKLFNLLSLKYNFKHKNYGYSSFNSFLEQINLFDMKFIDNQWYLFKKK